MNTGMIATRYAKALLLASEDKQCSSIVYSMMATLAESFDACESLHTALENPVLSVAKKQELIRTAAGNVENEVFERFVAIVLSNSRESFLHRIALCYCDFYREDSKICKGQLRTAVPLSKETEQAISDFLTKYSGHEVELHSRIDADILGGFILDIEGERLDASVAGQLRRVRKKLVNCK